MRLSIKAVSPGFRLDECRSAHFSDGLLSRVMDQWLETWNSLRLSASQNSSKEPLAIATVSCLRMSDFTPLYMC